MASAFTHAFAAFALGKSVTDEKLPASVWAAGMFCAVMPDADALGYFMGVPYDSLWGHRGITHSIVFAVILASMFAWLLSHDKRLTGRFVWLFTYFFACGISHGILDALTTGGLGVAFFAPFLLDRYFFALQLIKVSPMGVGRFFSERGLQVIASELKWVWVPLSMLVLVARLMRGIIKKY